MEEIPKKPETVDTVDKYEDITKKKRVAYEHAELVRSRSSVPQHVASKDHRTNAMQVVSFTYNCVFPR